MKTTMKRKIAAMLAALSLMTIGSAALAEANAAGTTPTAIAAQAENTSEETTTVSLTFPHGIKFGMTADEVKAAETETLRDQSFGEKQNPHVTVLTTEDINLNGHTGTVQYLFWDGKMYTFIDTIRDASAFDEYLASYKDSYGEPTVSSADGSATFVESVTGTHPEMSGDQYVWDLGNKYSLTLVKFGDNNFACIYIDAN